MRILFFLFLVGIQAIYADNSYSQTTRLNVNLRNKTIKEVFSEIEKESDYIFLYNDDNVDVSEKVSVNAQNQTIDQILNDVFKDTDYTYYISDRQVFVSKSASPAAPGNNRQERTQQSQITIKGTVVDSDGDPLVGVTVKLKSRNVTGAIANPNGEFSIDVENMDETLVFTYIGMKAKELKLKAGTTNYKIVMEYDDNLLGTVEINAGIIKRDKFGFTGSYTTISKEELKSVGNINVIQSLKTLDPAFTIIDNNLAGSNPNVMANIELRGQTSMNISSVQNDAAISSNSPLFILDGFEATLQEINDLDMNRIESITLLKDAGSTAIYGSKGANGVVVIETIKPKSGQVFVSYNGDFQLAAPDLSVYNMMNASEKLEFERLSGRYNLTGASSINIPELGPEYDRKKFYLQQIYFERLAKIQSGVDTYWLSEPVRTAFTQAHSATISGGEDLQYVAGLNYKNYLGVMKGSVRDSWGGNLKLTYRGVEGLSLQNNISITGTTGKDGSWGSFSDFANASPYFTKRNEDGSIPKYFDQEDLNVVAISSTAKNITSVNPLYNAMLNSRNDNNIFIVTNNTSVDFRINRDLMLRGNLSLRRETNNTVNFTDPSHSRFDNTTYDRKGSYRSGYTTNTSYNANVSANYLKSFAKHNFTLIARTNIEEVRNLSEAFAAVGFPEGSVGYPSQSFSYQPESRPDYSERMSRNAGFIAAFNYNYNYRYLLDLNYDIEGSSNFGRNKRYQSFWSVGLGWNVNREAFAKNWKWMDELKLRATYGMNGDQSINVVTNSIYSYYVGNSFFGQSAYLSQVGNPDLEWQVVKKKGAGVDLGILNSDLKIVFDVYAHKTDPQIVKLSQKPSTGVPDYPINLGYLNTSGYEFKLSYNLINRIKDGILVNIRLTGAHVESTYGGFENSLNALNEAYKKGEEDAGLSLNSLQHYEDGRSPTDLWAVRSVGIDPSTGREIFLNRNNEYTFVYDPNDRVVIANTRPDIQGIIGLNIRWKKLTGNFNLRYYLGAYALNTALFDKVENISRQNIINNQDKRALYDRWKQPGDVTQFKAIQDYLVAYTPVSSRFIQKDNYFRGESVRLMWNFTGDKWLNQLKLKDLSAGLSMSDFFNLSSIKMERGIDYPFQRSMMMDISARF